ncbi:MAG: hypothetical protein HQL98_05135 [Magnetococcales bacterium]|nr:hypothetical protein [Magnetococcales bacterium]
MKSSFKSGTETVLKKIKEANYYNSKRILCIIETENIFLIILEKKVRDFIVLVVENNMSCSCCHGNPCIRKDCPDNKILCNPSENKTIRNKYFKKFKVGRIYFSPIATTAPSGSKDLTNYVEHQKGVKMTSTENIATRNHFLSINMDNKILDGHDKRIYHQECHRPYRITNTRNFYKQSTQYPPCISNGRQLKGTFVDSFEFKLPESNSSIRASQSGLEDTSASLRKSL